MFRAATVRLAVFVTIVGLVLSACGGGNTGNPSEETTTPPEASPTTDASSTTAAAPTTEAMEEEPTIEPVTLQLAMPIADVGWPGGAIVEWAEAITEASGGAVEIEVFASSSLLPGPETVPGLADGRVQLGFTYNLYHPNEMPLWGVASIPFVTNDGFAMAAAFQEMYENNSDFQAEFDDMGVIPLWFAPVGSSSFGYAEPLTSVDDVSGLRLRAPGLAANIVGAAGADGVFIDGAEFYESMERGVIDGWTGTELPGAVFGVNIHEVTPAFTNPGFGPLSSSAVLIGRDTWEGLDEEVRSLITEVSAEYPNAFVDFVAQAESDACDLMLDEGSTVTLMPEEAVQEWAELLGTEIEDIVATTAEETRGMDREAFDAYLAEYRGAVEERTGESGYEEGHALCAARSG